MPIDGKQSRNEDEYFTRQHPESLQVRRARIAARRAKQVRPK